MSDDRALLDKFVESKNVFNPDILDCIANLSNDEVFTPPKLVNEVLDTLPPEIWHDSKITFLDPACKSGVWLREVTKRLINGLADEIPDLQERIDHILHKQVFGIAITELTSLLSRRSLYCSKYPNGRYSISRFDDVSGNIWYQNIDHKWKNGRCALCGANQSEYDRSEDKNSYAYGFIHLDPHYWEEVFGVKFDVIIGNPPYQLSDGGNSASAKPIFQYFVEVAKKLKPSYMTFIIPARWYSGGKGLDGFRNDMLQDDRMAEIYDFPNANDCFPGVLIAGGVMYFKWVFSHHNLCEIHTYIDGVELPTARRKLNEFDVFVRENQSATILRKVQSRHDRSIASHVSSRRPFGFATNFSDFSEFDDGNSYKIYSSNQVGDRKIGYVSKGLVTKGFQYIDKWKVLMPKAYRIGSTKDGGYINAIIAEPGSVCTETFIVIDAFEDEESARNLVSYIKTRFFRFMVSLRKITQDATAKVYEFVPNLTMDRAWSDHDLYERYGLDNEDVNFIESQIKEMK